MVSMMTAVTVCAVFASITVATMSTPTLCATNVTNIVPIQSPKKAPAVSRSPPCARTGNAASDSAPLMALFREEP